MTAPAMPRTPFWLRRPVVLDRIAQVLVWAIITIGIAVPTAGQTASAGTFVALVVSAAGFALSYRWPWPGVVLLAVAPTLAAVLGVDPVYTWNIAIFAVFRIALRSLPGLQVGLLVGATSFLGDFLYSGQFLEPAASIAGIATFAAAVAGGSIRAQSQYWRALEDRAQDAFATRESEVRRRVAEERLRIARDLHDVVGHEVAVVSMQLGVAEVNLPPGSSSSQAAIDAARAGVQSVLTEMQAILHILRRGEAQHSNEVLPEYGHIGALVESFAAVGLPVSSSITAKPANLEPATGAAAFRIVQEGLTNAQRYSSGHAAVSVQEQAGALVIVVSNPVDPAKRAARGEESGFGLVGMRERVASVGGSLQVDDDEAVFRVSATLDMSGGTRS